MEISLLCYELELKVCLVEIPNIVENGKFSKHIKGFILDSNMNLSGFVLKENSYTYFLFLKHLDDFCLFDYDLNFISMFKVNAELEYADVVIFENNKLLGVFEHEIFKSLNKEEKEKMLKRLSNIFVDILNNIKKF